MANYKSIPQIPVPSPGGNPGGLADKIAQLLKSVFASVANVTFVPLADVIRYGAQSLFDELEDELYDLYGDYIHEAANNPDVPEPARRLLSKIAVKRHPVQLLAVLPLVVFIITPILQALAKGMIDILTYLSHRVWHPFRLPFNVVMQAVRRFPEKENGLYSGMFDQGWTRDQIDLATTTTEQRANLDQYMYLVLRGTVSWEYAKAELVKQGWNADELDRVRVLSHIIPGVQDIITMAVKEAFNDQFAQLTGTDQEFPGEVSKWAQSQGLDDEWSKRYWRAHWNLPSMQMGLEMLHRGIISESELAQLLKALDYAPFWRDKLKGISYSPYTRVDIRRLYDRGIVTRDQVKRNYLDIGYDEKHAENLTLLTLSLSESTDKEATLSQVIDFYSRGILSRADAHNYILSLDYPPELANLYLADADVKKADQVKARRISPIHTLYVSNDINYAEASTKLTGLGYTGGEIQNFLDDWTMEKEAKVAHPSASQLDTFFRQDVIPESGYRSGLKDLGYLDSSIDWLVKSVLIDKAGDARKAALAARAEQDRLKSARTKSDYAVSKSALEVTEAETTAAVAEVQQAMSERRAKYQNDITLARSMVTPATLEGQARTDIAALQAQIDSLTLASSKLDQSIASENINIARITERIARRAADFVALSASGASDDEIGAAKLDKTQSDANDKAAIARSQVAIRQAQSDQADASAKVADLTNRISDRRAKLQSDLDTVSRLKSQQEIEQAYQVDLATYAESLDKLRDGLGQIKIAKAKLASGLASSLSTGG